MNREQRRSSLKAQHNHVASLPEKLTQLPRDQWPQPTISVWLSRDFMVQIFQEEGGVIRLSINRTRLRNDGQWCDGITWDELQQIKRDIGYGDKFAVEIYPADTDIVNVSNIRHLWLLPEPPVFAWRKND